VEFFVHDALSSGHPLDISSADDPSIPLVITVFHFALEGESDRLETSVRMLSNSQALERERKRERKKMKLLEICNVVHWMKVHVKEGTLSYLASGREVLGCSIVKHEEGTDLLRECLVSVNGNDMKAISHPVVWGFAHYFLHSLHCGYCF
jgi:hypothetical protein